MVQVEEEVLLYIQIQYEVLGL